MHQNPQTRGHSMMVEAGPNTLESKSTAPEVSIDIPDNAREDSDADPLTDGREQQEDDTKINDTHSTQSWPLTPPVSLSPPTPLVPSSREFFLEDNKGNEKRSVNHESRHIEDHTPPQESGYEDTVDKTSDERSAQQTSPGPKVKDITEEKVELQGSWKMKVISTNAKPTVDDRNGGDNNNRAEVSEVGREDENGNGDESESEYDGESEREDDDSISVPVEGNSLHALSQLEIASSIAIDDHHKESSQKNKSGKSKGKGKGKDSDPARVEKPKNKKGFAKLKSQLRHRTIGFAAKPEANPAPVSIYEIDDVSKWRWHWRETGGGGNLQSEHKHSVTVPRDEDWKCSLPARDIPSGFYSIVFCATISCNRDISEPLDSLTVDANPIDSSNNVVNMKKTCKTIVEKEELNQIKLRKKTRIRLHRQIELEKDGKHQYIELSMKVKACDSLKFKLYYVELHRCNITDSQDIVLFGEGKPQEYITVGRHLVNDGDENHARGPIVDVHSYNVSSSGTYATTLCFHEDNTAVIEIWSLKNDNNVAPRHHTTPLARRYIDIAENRPDRADVCLSISSNGYYVALHSNKLLDDGVNCQVLRRTKGAANGNNSELWNLSEISLPPGLQEFYGYGTFHFLSTENENEQALESERYITCDGESLSIYKTTGEWVGIQTIKISDEQKPASAPNTILSMRGNCFTWTGKKNNVSIIHVDTDKKINLPIDGANTKTRTCLSRDGSQVAVLAKGTIYIYETSSGKCVAEFGDGKYKNSRFAVVLENGFAIVINPPEKGETNVARRVDGKVWKREHDIHPDYGLRYPALMGQQLFTYSQGTVVNIIRMDSKMIGAPEPRIFKEDIKMDKVSMLKIAQSPQRTSLSDSSNAINLFTKNQVIHGKSTTILTIEVCHPDPQVSTSPTDGASATSKSPICLNIPLGTSHTAYPTFFLEASSQLIIIAGRYLQVWKLTSPTPQMSTTPANAASATSDDNIAELELVWALQQEDKAAYKLSDICHRQVKDAHADLTNGTQFKMTFEPAEWRRGPNGPLIYKESGGDRVVTFPYSSKDELSLSLEDHVKHGIRGVVNLYINGGPKCQKAAIRYLESLVQPSNENPDLCIVALCNIWRLDEKEFFEKIMAELLPKTRSTWVPKMNARNKIKGQDPLAILLKRAKTEPSAIGVAKVIMDYCVSHANSSMNLKFLAPVFISMNRLRKMFPEEAQGCLDRMAFIHAMQRQHIIHNHIIVHSPIRRLLQHWKPTKKLWETKKPIMQLCENSEQDTANELFTLPVFVASFDALWFYNFDDDRGKNSKMPTKARTMATTTTTTTNGESTAKMSRWWILLYMIREKLKLRSKIYVECYDFNLEIFDNPAIAALVMYKWNTIGFPYWLFRFVFQCCYYTMIVLAAILQVYFPYRPVLVGIFITIIVMAVVFLWLELLQAVPGPWKYMKSSYNLLDLVAYLTPMAAAIDQLVVIANNNPQGNTRLLSFSVLIAFLHGLFEMRIDGSVCKFVTIIQQAVFEIEVFFVIFGGGIVAFTIAMLHLLHACPLGGCSDANSDGSSFPTHIFGALSATYFFMGGRYDPVSDNFNSEDWAFHIMMVFFFFFTVILMLNVLIALINVAFGKAGDDWRLAWVESRLSYIEAAENMSYHVPGYRKSHSYFPDEIYFTATEKEVKEFEEKHELCGSDKDRMLKELREEMRKEIMVDMKWMKGQFQELVDHTKGGSERGHSAH